MFSTTQLKNLERETSELIRQAGQQILQTWGSQKKISFKDARDFSTNIDIEIENYLRGKLHTLLPEAGFIVEEGLTSEESVYNWAIDPIDLTKNFAKQLPMFYTQVALLEKGEPLLGVIYNPISDQLFSASKGNGANLNGSPLHTTETRDPKSAIIDIDFGGINNFTENNNKIFSELTHLFYRVRISGGAFPVYLTTGAIDAYIVLNPTTKLVDQVPRIILLRETGYKTEYIQASQRKILVSSYETIFDIIKKLLLATNK